MAMYAPATEAPFQFGPIKSCFFRNLLPYQACEHLVSNIAELQKVTKSNLSQNCTFYGCFRVIPKSGYTHVLDISVLFLPQKHG